MRHTVLDETTRVNLTLAAVIMALGAIIVTVATVVNLKADIDHRIELLESEDARINYRINALEEEFMSAKALLQKNETTLAVIQSDIQWIRKYMEADE